MLKQTLAFVALSVSCVANAAIIDLGNITRDSVTDLDWLDVTQTAGISVNEVLLEMDGGSLVGWRYATANELDQLISNFGYVAVTSNCIYGEMYCDRQMPGDPKVIETMIKTLGDTGDRNFDSMNSQFDVSATGAGRTYGFIGTNLRNSNTRDIAVIDDYELVYRSSGQVYFDYDDHVRTVFSNADLDYSSEVLGSFLVQTSVVPVPAAAWLFGSGLAGIARRKKA